MRSFNQQPFCCGARLCAKHQPQRVEGGDTVLNSKLLRLVGTTQPRSNQCSSQNENRSL
jgi:hypothetical protein